MKSITLDIGKGRTGESSPKYPQEPTHVAFYTFSYCIYKHMQYSYVGLREKKTEGGSLAVD